MIRTRPLFWIFLVLSACQNRKPAPEPKINGVSYVASRDSITAEHLQPLEALGANYASIMPYAFIRSAEEPELFYNTERQWYGETVEGVGQYIEALHAKDIKVMLKPHLWIGDGTFTGDLNLKTENAWQQFEADYEQYILSFAQVADKNKVEVFCLGTELFRFVQQRTAFWEQLITKVKTIYKGKLTYAENWDKVAENPLWEQLNFIGVDAYFPVAQEKSPTLKAAQNGWKPHKNLLKSLANKYEKPILFTEFGYRSIDYAGKQPWHTVRSETGVNLQAQLNLTKALFNEFWNETWFAGGFVWKWHPNHKRAGGPENNRFTPQNKPVEVFLKERYHQKQ